MLEKNGIIYFLDFKFHIAILVSEVFHGQVYQMNFADLQKKP